MIPKQSKRLEFWVKNGLGHGMASLWHQGWAIMGLEPGMVYFPIYKKRGASQRTPKKSSKNHSWSLGLGSGWLKFCGTDWIFGTFFYGLLWNVAKFPKERQPGTLVQIFGSHPRAPKCWFVSTWVLMFSFLDVVVDDYFLGRLLFFFGNVITT